MSLNIATLNVNGLRNKKKREHTFNWLNSKKYAVICIQETHCSLDDVALWKSEWKTAGGVDSAWNCGTKESRGVAILFGKNFCENVSITNDNPNGRVIRCDIKLDNALYHISNVYAPNNGLERKQFFESFHNLMGNFGDDSVDHYNIIVGDFNCALDKRLDRSPAHKSDDIGAKELKFLINQYDLSDAWREQYPSKKHFSFRRVNSSSRIDYIFCSKSLNSNIFNTRISHFPFSDHDLVSTKIKLDEIARGPGI